MRIAAGKTVDEVAVHLECSAAKISRIENGLVGVRIQDAREMLDLYEVLDEQRESVLELVRQSRGRGWWHPYADVMPDGFDRVVGFEDEATARWELESRLVSGLLQTRQYAADMMPAVRDDPPRVWERRIELRMARQRILSRPEISFSFVLDEAVLLRQVGSAASMAEQCRRLISHAGAPNITLRIIPFAAGVHQTVGASFTIMAFADPADPKVVCEELYKKTVIHESAEVSGRFTAAFDQAQAFALSERDSLALLEQTAERYLP